VQYASPAKINLALDVLGKRSDGYHEIETIFQEITLKDEIEIFSTETDITLRCEPAICPEDQRNLAFLAAQLLREKQIEKRGCHIVIHKQIPVGAGLGGGSSNAATVLKALNNEWQIGLTVQDLQALAEKIGSDAPFFITGGTAVGCGRGEKLTPVPFSIEYWGVLVCPDFSVSTQWAYQTGNFSLTKTAKSSKFFRLLKSLDDPGKWKSQLKNDLETVVFPRYPALRAIVDKFYELNAFYSSMSGSGSSIFGLFLSLEEANKAASVFGNKFKVFVFQPLMDK
jgi:4-diphosphocytidyl-2-C-methyl-D-erythritol kinase